MITGDIYGWLFAKHGSMLDAHYLRESYQQTYFADEKVALQVWAICLTLFAQWVVDMKWQSCLRKATGWQDYGKTQSAEQIKQFWDPGS